MSCAPINHAHQMKTDPPTPTDTGYEWPSNLELESRLIFSNYTGNTASNINANDPIFYSEALILLLFKVERPNGETPMLLWISQKDPSP